MWLANVFSINALLSSLIEGSGAVRISLASEISDHCFVEVLFYRKFVFPLFSPGMCTSVLSNSVVSRCLGYCFNKVSLIITCLNLCRPLA